MVSTPDRRSWLALLAPACWLIAASGQAASPPSSDLIGRAEAAIAARDGIAAEAYLQRALAAGVPKPEVAPSMGEALLLQGATDRARSWLAGGQFASGRESYGWRMLGRLEVAQGNLAAAGRAYDRALRFTPDDSILWVDIGRLRYAGGEQLQAIEAAEKALDGDPRQPRALEFRGQLVRDQFGLVPALTWFKAGLARAPDDLALLGEYAATLGELNQARAMLQVTRRMLKLDPGNPRARYLQAVLAARAGKMELARSLLSRTGDRLAEVPAAMLLRGVLELEAGNANLAVDVLDRLVRRQPANERARLLLARAAYVSGDRVQLRNVVQDAANPSPYLSALLDRAGEPRKGAGYKAALTSSRANSSEQFVPIGNSDDLRVLAADWGARRGTIAAGVPYVRKLLSIGKPGLAATVAEQLRKAHPGSADVQAIAGDVELLRGHAAGALERYRVAARVRVTPDLLARMAAAMDRSGKSRQADALVEAHLAANPTNIDVSRLAAARAKRRGDRARAKALDEFLSPVAPRTGR